jgi:membrane protein implicated in regulation of membrane protease activity
MTREDKRIMFATAIAALFIYVLFSGLHGAMTSKGYAVWHPWIAAFCASAWSVVSVVTWMDSAAALDKQRKEKWFQLTDEEAEILEAIRSKK